jgi:hypothetical protein
MRALVALLVTLPLLGLEPAPDFRGTWTVQDVHYAPWILKFRVEEGQLSGTVQQSPHDKILDHYTSLSKPTQIYMGRIDGGTISFRVDSPGASEQRTATFTGKIDGDKIYFTRSIKVFREGDPGENGIYGWNGARSFIAYKGEPMTDKRKKANKPRKDVE